jgi:peroxiredoxin
MTHSSRRGLLIVFGLAVAQGGAYAVYRVVEGERAAGHENASFSMDAATGHAPDIELLHADGRKVRVSDFNGKVVVVHFWATWCKPCARELPGLLELAERIAPKGVTVLAVSLDDNWANVQTFLGAAEMPEAVVRGVTGAEGRAYGVGVLPQTFIVGTRGQLLRHAVGAREWASQGAAETILSARAPEGS